jgi:hypothetical protein
VTFLYVTMWGLIASAAFGLFALTAWLVIGAFFNYGFFVGATCAAVAAGLWAELAVWFCEHGS